MPEETMLLSPPADVAGLRAALIEARADQERSDVNFRRLDEILCCLRRANRKLREAGLSQSGEIVRLRDQLKARGKGNAEGSCDAIADRPAVAHRLALAQGQEIVRLRDQLISHGLEPLVEL